MDLLPALSCLHLNYTSTWWAQHALSRQDKSNDDDNNQHFLTSALNGYITWGRSRACSSPSGAKEREPNLIYFVNSSHSVFAEKKISIFASLICVASPPFARCERTQRGGESCWGFLGVTYGCTSEELFTFKPLCCPEPTRFARCILWKMIRVNRCNYDCCTETLINQSAQEFIKK